MTQPIASSAALPGADLRDLIACPACDALYHVVPPRPGERSVCTRCHHVLITPIKGSIVRIVALSLTVQILLTTAVFTPFLKIEAVGLSSSASIFQAALSFSKAHMVALSVMMLGFIVFIPLLRSMLLIYVLAPLLLGRRPLPGARRGFRWTEELRPWSMAEIFVLGVGVALVKIADLAHVELGIAFWLFAALVLVTVLQDGSMCRWSIWEALDRADADADAAND